MNRSEPEAPVAVVTGAGRGIGRASAIALARAGWKVALVARTAGDVERVAGEIRREQGHVVACPTDVSIPESVGEMVEAVHRGLGVPDCLVNGAAVVQPVGPVIDTDPRAWARALEINLLGAFLCARAVLPAMAERGRGGILNLVSGMGQRVFPRFSAYSVAKAGLIHLTRVLAEEVRSQGIRVNALDPGMVDTGMHEEVRGMSADRVGREMLDRLRSAHAEGMLKPPEVVGDAIARFVEGPGRRLTGQVGTLRDFGLL